ncbi:hypothetical protein ZWY2020_026022 [Hordeum vulgare]|nr:hypothetical protein ZWY2020_026022 [Hordeum vulgare]
MKNFPPTFLDSSNFWNTNNNLLQLQQIGTNTPSPSSPGDGGGNNSNQESFMATAGVGAGGGGGDGCCGVRDGDCGGSRISMPMSMLERARLARVPQPVSGLNCPRCNSTNTKFCYFNNYSLTQPRHFCRVCRRYWTHGGALRNVPIGGRYRRHAKRRAKPKTATSRAPAAGTTSSRTTTCATSSPRLQYSMFGSASSPDSWFADSFDLASLSFSYPARVLFPDSDSYGIDGCEQQHQHQSHGNGMEQWVAAHMESFPLMHAMDHQMYERSIPITNGDDARHVSPRAIRHYNVGEGMATTEEASGSTTRRPRETTIFQRFN